MSPIRLECQIDASPAETFRAITDLPRIPEAIPDIQSITVLTDGPIGVGTRYTEARKMFGKVSEETFEITAFDPPTDRQPGRYVMEADSCGMHMVVTHTLTTQDGGTLLEMEMTGTPNPGAWLAKLMAPLAGLLTGPAMKKCMQKDLDRLAEFAAGSRDPAPTPA